MLTRGQVGAVVGLTVVVVTIGRLVVGCAVVCFCDILVIVSNDNVKMS